MSAYPSYCCQRCGLSIGWLMRFAEMVFGQIHECDKSTTGEG